MKIPQIPYVAAQWRCEHPGEQIPDGHVFTQPWPAGPDGGRRDQVIYYQYRHDRPAARCAGSMNRSRKRSRPWPGTRQARPIYHHLRDSIEAHLTIVFAALAVSRRIEH
jgi:hypothetical protein